MDGVYAAMMVGESDVGRALLSDLARERVGDRAKSVETLAHDRFEVERLGAAARRRIMDEFSDGAIAGKTLSFWRSLTPATG